MSTHGGTTRDSEPPLETIRTAFENAANLILTDENQPAGIENNIEACRECLDELYSFILSRIEDIFEISSFIGERANIRGIRRSVEELGAYPLLTAELGAPGPGTGPGGGGSGSSGSTMRRQVEMAIRGVLGRVPRRADARSFVAALNQSFEVRQFEGRTEVAWRPHSFVGQADLSGGVTGAQASLATSAALGLDNVLPLLESLYPLNSDADEEMGEALRAIVRSELIEVVNELKVEGGPRVARVDNIFKQLLGDESDDDDGDLQELKTAFGLDEEHVNTLDEERNSSNFIALSDFASNLKTSWDNFKGRGTIGKDLGTRLVLLSRALTVAAESVEETLSAMDSVFVGAAERQVASFEDCQGRSIILDELLSWITSFTTEEAPRLVQEGGRRGASALIRTARILAGLVEHLIEVIPTEPTLPRGIQHARVIRPLYELAGYLDQVRQIADDISQR